MIRTGWLMSAILVLLVSTEVGAQGTLQRTRDGVHPTSPSSPANSRWPASSGSSTNSAGSNNSGNSSNNNESYDLAGVGAVAATGVFVAGLVVLAPFYGPMDWLNDSFQNRMFFGPHPYAGSYHGYQLVTAEAFANQYQTDSQNVPRKDWAVRLQIENGNDFSGLNRLGGQIKIDHAYRFGIVSNWSFFRERLPCGCIDETLIGDTNLTFRFAQGETAGFYAGLGFRMLSDRQRTDFGFNFTYGADWFPLRPFVVSGVFDAGNLGSAGVVHARGTVGATYHGWELFAGYDFLRIGRANLQGPMVGVRWWF